MREIWDVIVVGGGPVGVFAAIEMAQAGHSVRIIEKGTSPYSLPRAVHIDHEIMRLFAGIGVADRMQGRMRAGDGHLHIGADHGVIRFMSAAGEPRPFGYANDYFFNQPELEHILRQRLAGLPNARFDLGLEVVDLQQDDLGVTVAISDGTRARARFVIGCDGARSLVRKSQGVPLDDLAFEEPWLVVDAEVDGPIRFPDLCGVPEGANLQNLSVMLCDPRRPATLVPGRGNHRRWEFMLLPNESDAEMAKPDKVAELIAPFVAGRAHEVIRAATYRFHGLVAKNWRKGRIFLPGTRRIRRPLSLAKACATGSATRPTWPGSWAWCCGVWPMTRCLRPIKPNARPALLSIKEKPFMDIRIKGSKKPTPTPSELSYGLTTKDVLCVLTK